MFLIKFKMNLLMFFNFEFNDQYFFIMFNRIG